MEKAWFEMREQIRRRYADAVWIPLRDRTQVSEKEYGELGHKSEYIGVRSLAVRLDCRAKGEKITWSDTSLEHRVYAYDGGYKPAECYELDLGEPFGIELVLVQQFDGVGSRRWYLNQDLIFALGLSREATFGCVRPRVTPRLPA